MVEKLIVKNRDAIYYLCERQWGGVHLLICDYLSDFCDEWAWTVAFSDKEEAKE